VEGLLLYTSAASRTRQCPQSFAYTGAVITLGTLAARAPRQRDNGHSTGDCAWKT